MFNMSHIVPHKLNCPTFGLFDPTLLEKRDSKGHLMLKRFYKEKKEPFWHKGSSKGYYSFIYYIILQHFVVRN